MVKRATLSSVSRALVLIALVLFQDLPSGESIRIKAGAKDGLETGAESSHQMASGLPGLVAEDLVQKEEFGRVQKINEWILSHPKINRFADVTDETKDTIKPQFLEAFRFEMIGEPVIEKAIGSLQIGEADNVMVIGAVPLSHPLLMADIGGATTNILSQIVDIVHVFGYNAGNLEINTGKESWHEFNFDAEVNQAADPSIVRGAKVFLDLRFGGGTDRSNGKYLNDANKVVALFGGNKPASITMMGSSWASPNNFNDYRRYDHIGYLSRKMFQYLKFGEFMNPRTSCTIEPVYQVLKRFSDSTLPESIDGVSSYEFNSAGAALFADSQDLVNLFQNAIDAMHDILLWNPMTQVTKNRLKEYKYDAKNVGDAWVNYLYNELSTLHRHTSCVQKLRTNVHYASPEAEHVLSLGPLGGGIDKLYKEFKSETGAITATTAALMCLYAAETGGRGQFMTLIDAWLSRNPAMEPQVSKWPTYMKPRVLEAFRKEMIGEPNVNGALQHLRADKVMVIGAVPLTHPLLMADIGGVTSYLLSGITDAVHVFGYNADRLEANIDKVQWHDFNFNEEDPQPADARLVQGARVFLDLRFGGGTDRANGNYFNDANRVIKLFGGQKPGSITMMGSSWASPSNFNDYRRYDHIGYLSRKLIQYLMFGEFMNPSYQGYFVPVYEVLRRFSDSRLSTTIHGVESYEFRSAGAELIGKSPALINLFQNAIDAMHDILLWNPRTQVTKSRLKEYKLDATEAGNEWVDYLHSELSILQEHTYYIQQLRSTVHYASPHAEHVLSLGPIAGPITKLKEEFTRDTGAITATEAAFMCLSAAETGGRGPLMNPINAWRSRNPHPPNDKWPEFMKPLVLEAFRTEVIGEPNTEAALQDLKTKRVIGEHDKVMVIGAVPLTHPLLMADIGGVTSQLLSNLVEVVHVFGYNNKGLEATVRNVQWHDFNFEEQAQPAAEPIVEGAKVFLDLRFGGGTDRSTGKYVEDAQRVLDLFGNGVKPASITMMGSSWANPTNLNKYRRYDHIGYLSRKMIQYLKFGEFMNPGTCPPLEPVYQVLRRFSDGTTTIDPQTYAYGTPGAKLFDNSETLRDLFQNAIDAMHDILLWKPTEGVDIEKLKMYKKNAWGAEAKWVEYVFGELTILQEHTACIQKLRRNVHYASPERTEHVLSLGPIGGPITKLATEFTRENGAITATEAALWCLYAAGSGEQVAAPRPKPSRPRASRPQPKASGGMIESVMRSMKMGGLYDAAVAMKK